MKPLFYLQTKLVQIIADCGILKLTKLDKDRFRQNLGEVDKAYKEVAYRLGVLSEKEFKKVIKNDL